MSDRHEKWVKVDPGTVIPAGQPYRVERPRGGISGETCVEYIRDLPVEVLEISEWFIDSSWKPPLVLPTEPTWGIAVGRFGSVVSGEWRKNQDAEVFEHARERWDAVDVIDFIPLTDEQVARIEAAR